MPSRDIGLPFYPLVFSLVGYLLLKHPDVTVATYKRRQMKHLKQASETLAKTSEKH
jgi:hypothetical protein